MRGRRTISGGAALVFMCLWLVGLSAAPGLAQNGGTAGAGMKRSARNLVQACEAEQAATSWCAAYLMGVADTLTAFGEGGHKGGLCGASYAIEDLGEIFLTWIREHPQFLDLDMLAGASLALRGRWPCR